MKKKSEFEAPYIGIETPNARRQIVPLRDVLDSNEFRSSTEGATILLSLNVKIL